MHYNLESKKMDRYKSVILNISSGYFAIIKKIAIIISLVILIAVLSFIIVFPLWFLAVKSSFIYNLVFGSLLGLVFTVFIIIKLHKSGTKTIRSVITGLRKIAVVFLYILIIYIIVWLFAMHFTIAALVVTVLYLFIAGYFKFGRNRNR